MYLLKKTFYLFLITSIIAFSNKGFSQVLGLELLGEEDEIELKFNYSQGFIIVDIKFNTAVPLKFILDTGAEHIILFDKTITDIFGLEYSNKISLVGSDLNREVFAFISRNIPIQLEGCKTVKRDVIVLEEDFLYLEEITGEPIHGIIGSRFFRGLVLDINYRQKRIKLINSGKFEPPKKGYTKIDILKEGHKPYFASHIVNSTGDTIPVNLLIDTGSALPFMVFLDSHPSLNLPDNIIKGKLGKGLGGNLEGYLGKVQQLEFGPFQFNSLVTRFQNIDENNDIDIHKYRNGLVGNPILSRFQLILDLVKDELYVKPHKNLNKRFEYDKSGLTIYAFGYNLDSYYIKDVVEDSPAQLAGIKPGDILKKIGILPANFHSLETITKKFEKKEGKKFKLTLERNGVRYKTHIILRDMLKVKP